MYIVALELRIEELNILCKGNHQANKANWVATKKIKTIVDQVVAMASITTSLSNLLNPASLFKKIHKLGQQSHISRNNVNKTNSHLILNLA